MSRWWEMMEKVLMRETGLSFIIISSTFFALFASAIIIPKYFSDGLNFLWFKTKLTKSFAATPPPAMIPRSVIEGKISQDFLKHSRYFVLFKMISQFLPWVPRELKKEEIIIKRCKVDERPRDQRPHQHRRRNPVGEWWDIIFRNLEGFLVGRVMSPGSLLWSNVSNASVSLV